MVQLSESTAGTVWPEARPLRIGGGRTGVVVCHGFTGSVQSIAPWAHGLATADGDWPGCTVVAPRLPGHGTHWRDLARTRWWDWYAAVEDAYLQLAPTVDRVFVAGLSMGGALALRLAQRHAVAGVLLVNPAIATRDRRIAPAAALHRLLPAQKGIASDVAKPGVVERGYPKFSVTSLATMTKLWRLTARNLGKVGAPVLLLRSAQDHVVDDLSAELIRKRVADVRYVELADSFHVATLDNDADLIVEESRRFIGATS